MKIYTEKDRIPYFVQPGFETNYPKESQERRKVERNVKNDYVEMELLNKKQFFRMEILSFS